MSIFILVSNDTLWLNITRLYNRFINYISLSWSEIMMQSKKTCFFNKKQVFKKKNIIQNKWFFMFFYYYLQFKGRKVFFLILWSAYSRYIQVLKHYIQYVNRIFIDSETSYSMNYNTNLHSNIKLNNYNS